MRTLLAIAATVILSACSALWHSTPKLEQPVKGETVELHAYAYGDVNNQGNVANPLSISNGKVIFNYGDLCELDPMYRHYVTVAAFGNGTVLLRYSGTHPDPNAKNRNCFDGILFDVSRDSFDGIRYRHIEFLKRKTVETAEKK